MKIILSRKGFDSENGGQPSPILSDGTLLSLPIPGNKTNGIKYGEVAYNGKPYSDIIKELRPNPSVNASTICHLDPDLRYELRERKNGWKGLFGQSKAAQGHLRNNHVGKGDLFLFFGTYREAEIVNGHFQYKPNTPELHSIFGYMQIGKIYTTLEELPEYAKYHPHAVYFGTVANNCIYEAAETLDFNPALPGYGCLKYNQTAKETVKLTKAGEGKSHWDLPEFFKELKITYHTKESFKDEYFQSAGKGQEFVIEDNPRVTEWAKEIICGNYDSKA